MPFDGPRVAPPFELPSDNKKLLAKALEMIEQCGASRGNRAAFYRLLHTMMETGKPDGTRSLINKLYSHVDRLASHLYSSTELKFIIDFENAYPKNILERGARAAKILSRDFEMSNSDIVFGSGVFCALEFGAAVLKQWPEERGPDRRAVINTKLVMPWQFGVYREDETDIDRQPALCESSLLSLPEVWRRIWHLPGAEDMFRRIESHATKGAGSDENLGFLHQVWSTSQINTTGVASNPAPPGGVVSLSGPSTWGMMGPQNDVELVKMHELWVWGGHDYVTIQVIEPDILVSPIFKRSNLLISGDHHTGLHPYTVIRPNHSEGNVWGRSELMDLVGPQEWLSETASDVKRLVGLLVDKVIGFEGADDITDEKYGQMREAGYYTVQAGAKMVDMTPTFPPELLPLIDKLQGLIDAAGGFDNILSGRGEQGVRAGVHADTLLKTASPRIRDRALLVERQLASAADLRLSIMQAKDPRKYWTDGTSVEKMKETEFLLTDLPEDRRVTVDSHSSSPIFKDQHMQEMGFLRKTGDVDGRSMIEMSDLPNKQILLMRYDEKQAQQQRLMAEHPELLAKMLTGKKGAK